MPNFLKKRWLSYPFFLFLLFTIILIIYLSFYRWEAAIIALIILSGITYSTYRYEQQIQEETEQYISTLSYRVKKVGEEALMEMPIGIILYNDDYQIEWANPYIGSWFEHDTLVGLSINDISEALSPVLNDESDEEIIQINEHNFRVQIKREEKLLYFFDITEKTEIERLYEEGQPILGVIYLDNYDELTQGMNDQLKSRINSQVTSMLNKWSIDNGIFLKRTSSERFVAVLSQQILEQLERTKFDILDQIREFTSKQNVPLTLSIGIGEGSDSLPELGSLAQSSLDLALGRGGDQVAIKQVNGKVKFYGGKTNPVEKRTRVRARVISHALRELVLASDNVIIMGHKSPDMDSIGASIGVLKVAEVNDANGYVVINKEGLDTGVQRLVDNIRQNNDLWNRFISPDEALEIINEGTLLVIVDTHKPSLVIDERLLHRVDHVVVIDHHRRGEEFIENPLLVYMEPYASSTAELVTELLEYQPKHLKLDSLESTALLAGIVVDTKSFTLRTGSRTFDAASYLRGQGADTILVQTFLKENLEEYVKRSRLIESATIYRDGIAISKADPNETYGQVMIAQAADALLSMTGVIASFVISLRDDGKVSVSARSLGDINVQLIMEGMNGGGHLTNAATQIEDATVDEVEEQLKAVVDEYVDGGNGE
ncbi:DHH family phosphoesterase [Bacillus solimangrovi]|uniref:Cyclic-di-AMP phosphodiesterase n=1 Tax=Bacillus solimangrovi TaxID=1305675 RepID=A0A1E5LCE2_9BACI|nr:DHH family phosphoesterase [Bacillus solimangrovi]OEH91737.1 hypothetical protein BFG57_17815 [Bacillus solimangrovi]